MEQGIIAAVIGLVIFLMGASFGYNRGHKKGSSLGIGIGVEVGAYTLYGILMQSGVITLKQSQDDVLNYEIHGDSEKCINYNHLMQIVENNQHSQEI
jgi:hypothetical protein